MDLDLVVRFLLALLFVLALIGLFAWAARRFGLSGRLGPAAGRTRRLKVIEVAPLDGKTRLVLLRRDDVEHLVMLGAGAATVIESGIAAPTAGGSFAALVPTTGTPSGEAQR